MRRYHNDPVSWKIGCSSDGRDPDANRLCGLWRETIGSWHGCVHPQGNVHLSVPSRPGMGKLEFETADVGNASPALPPDPGAWVRNRSNDGSAVLMPMPCGSRDCEKGAWPLAGAMTRAVKHTMR